MRNLALIVSLFVFLHIQWSILAHQLMSRSLLLSCIPLLLHLGASMSTLLLSSDIAMGCVYSIVILLSMIMMQGLFIIKHLSPSPLHQ